MKRICYAALPALLLCGGCFPSMLGLNETKPPAPAPVVQAPPPPPVTAESVNNENAHKKAAALTDELDRDRDQP